MEVTAFGLRACTIMVIWHLTPDAARFPFFVSAGQHVNLQFGTWPIEGGQRTWIEYQVLHQDGTVQRGQVEGTWNVNREANSYWFLNVGPFADGDRVEYWLRGSSPAGSSDGEPFLFVVSPKLYLAILWHQHQPLYKDLHATRPQGAYRFPLGAPARHSRLLRDGRAAGTASRGASHHQSHARPPPTARGLY
ncbi:MAG: hypothetical protein NDI90_02540 [Nitrospira sp. BO4]|nr:hypothetical protein [Nitrospira sp. BO4]